MDDSLTRALVAAGRAFVDSLERDIAPLTDEGSKEVLAGSAASMLEVLRSIARINVEQGRGANTDEVRDIARRAGMDPRGIAGYHSANLLEKRSDGRWLRSDGRDRLERLLQHSGVGPHKAEQVDPGDEEPLGRRPRFLLGFGIEGDEGPEIVKRSSKTAAPDHPVASSLAFQARPPERTQTAVLASARPRTLGLGGLTWNGHDDPIGLLGRRPGESARESWRLLPLRGWSNAKEIPLPPRGA